MRRRLPLLGLILLGLLAASGLAAGFLLWPVELEEPVVLRLPHGAGAGAIAARLQEGGVVRSALGFRLTAHLAGRAGGLRAGEYRFQGQLTTSDVLNRLVEGQVVLHPLTIPEGLTRQQTLGVLLAAPLEIQGDLQAASLNVDLIRDLDPEALDLEGYLFPETYHFPWGVSAELVVATMVKRFRKVAADITTRVGPPPSGTRAWVTLASLVEEETGRPDERDLVAGVFANRLQRGMLLQCDPTVIYALEVAGRTRNGSLARYLDFDHPYNTYRYAGLPPGPIASPGAASLLAALRPAATDALYFVADGTGGHRFSRNLAEHNRAVRAWRQHVQAAKSRP